MSEAFEKLQQLSLEDRNRVLHLIDELYAKNENREIMEQIATYTSKSKAFDVVRKDADIYSLADLKVKFG